MVELTQKTKKLIDIIFHESNRAEVVELLKYECADNLFLFDDPNLLDRIRFAAIKASEGQMDYLYDAVDLAQIDWRDLLVGSGFGEEKNHVIWANKVIINNYYKFVLSYIKRFIRWD